MIFYFFLREDRFREQGEEIQKKTYKQLDTEGRRLYDSLNNDGKQLAVRLSKQYVNKNQAVREAVKQMEPPNTQADY